MVDLARELIKRKSAKFDAAAFSDHYADALRALVEEKRKGKQTVEVSGDDAPRRGGQVIDLMDALKKSLNKGKSGGSRKPATGRSASKSRKAS
jgi:DNA end-binding protein Ku